MYILEIKSISAAFRLYKSLANISFLKVAQKFFELIRLIVFFSVCLKYFVNLNTTLKKSTNRNLTYSGPRNYLII